MIDEKNGLHANGVPFVRQGRGCETLGIQDRYAAP